MSGWARHDYTLTFRAATPVHVGAAGADALTDLPLATDGQGRLVIPGSSWAGVLRALARARLGASVEHLFGPEPGAPDPRAGHLFIDDTALGPDTTVASRTGVGIDRRRAAAADRLLYERLVVAAGTEFVLHLRHEGPDPQPARALVALVRALGLRVGGASARGLGRLDCTAATVREVDLDSRAGLLTALRGQTPTIPVPPDPEAVSPLLRVELRWRARRPVVVASGAPGESADAVPLLTPSATGTGLVPVLPGSSVRGVLRAAAEAVLRTVLYLDPPAEDSVSAGEFTGWAPSFEPLFGSVERAGALAVPDVGALVDPVDPAAWRHYLRTGTPAASWQHERTHVALDRWTGGAADQRLFTVQETTDVRWAPIVLELDPVRLGGHARAAVVLLGTAVALLRDGQLGIGRGSTRGLGEIEVTGIRTSGAEALGLPELDTDGPLWPWLRAVADGASLEELMLG
jgi:CRISPR/Cas system CSM-associated protein Csm3 (group 7 of RAMP superfamily)